MIFDTCLLAPEQRAERGLRFAALRERALEVIEDGAGLDFLFPRDPVVAAEIGELAALEAECCAAFTSIEVGPDSIRAHLRR